MEIKTMMFALPSMFIVLPVKRRNPPPHRGRGVPVVEGGTMDLAKNNFPTESESRIKRMIG